MSFTLDNKAALRRGFFRILGVAPLDDSVSEHDSEAEETVNYFIQHGLWNAQAFLVTNTDANRWKATSGALTVLGTDATGGRSVALADDFLRLAGDEHHSALFDTGNQYRPWGTMVDPRTSQGIVGSSAYWVEDDTIRFSMGATIPAGLQYNYFQRHAVLDEDTAINFQLDLRPLIVAEAAALALAESWVPFDDAKTEANIQRNQAYWRSMATSRSRRTRRPSQFRKEPNPSGSNWL